MRTISTRQLETETEKSDVYALRYDYYVVTRELDVEADHGARRLCDVRDTAALQFATFAGDDLVGCFRVEVGAPDNIRFGADWAYGDFLDVVPPSVALVSGLCTLPYLRDARRVIDHMVCESVAIAKELQLPHVFFETSPDLWPEFHANGLTRKGGSLTDAQTGLQTAVFQLDCRARVRFPQETSIWAGANDDGAAAATEETMRPRLAIVVGGRR